MANLTKIRARSPLVDGGTVHATCRTTDDGKPSFVLEISEAWREGGKHDEYMAHLSKAEVLTVISEWTAALARMERTAK